VSVAEVEAEAEAEPHVKVHTDGASLGRWISRNIRSNKSAITHSPHHRRRPNRRRYRSRIREEPTSRVVGYGSSKPFILIRRVYRSLSAFQITPLPYHFPRLTGICIAVRIHNPEATGELRSRCENVGRRYRLLGCHYSRWRSHGRPSLIDWKISVLFDSQATPRRSVNLFSELVMWWTYDLNKVAGYKIPEVLHRGSLRCLVKTVCSHLSMFDRWVSELIMRSGMTKPCGGCLSS